MSIPNEDHETHNDLDNLGKSLGIEAGEPAAAAKRAAPGILRYLPKLFQEAWGKGAYFQLDNVTGDVMMDGFYKMGPLRLTLDGESVVAHEGEKRTPILSYNDLVDINFRYWCRLNSRNKGTYIQPEQPWLESFKDRGMVTRTVVFVPKEAKE